MCNFSYMVHVVGEKKATTSEIFSYEKDLATVSKLYGILSGQSSIEEENYLQEEVNFDREGQTS